MAEITPPVAAGRETEATDVLVTVRCQRCGGSGKDPHFGSGRWPNGGMVERWPCQANHGGCGGSGEESAVIVGFDRATYLLGKLAIAVPNATKAELAAGRAALAAFDSSGEASNGK